MGSTSGKILDEEAGSPYLRIRDAIIEGQFPPNTALVEQNLAEWCGVSRTPIREALRRLEQDGLVERSSRGLVVTNRTPEQILDTYEVRIVLEEAVARFAAQRHTQIDRIRLGAVAGLDSTTRGSYFLDAFASGRISSIGEQP